MSAGEPQPGNKAEQRHENAKRNPVYPAHGYPPWSRNRKSIVGGKVDHGGEDCADDDP